MAKNDRLRSPHIIVQLFLGMALFGSATPLSKIIGQHFPVFTASFLRMAIASSVLGPIVWMSTKRFADIKKSDLWVITAIAAFGMVGFTTAMLFGMRMTTGVIGSTIMSATPAITAAAAILFFGAAINWRNGSALALAVLGVVTINLFRGGQDETGQVLILGSLLVTLAICCEAAYTLLSRALSDGISSLEVIFAACLLAAPCFLLLALVFDPQPFDFSNNSIQSWVAIMFWGAATGGLAPVLWYNGARCAPAMMTAGAMTIMPITALVLSYILLGEPFRWVHLIGFGLVFLGLIFIVTDKARSG